MGVFCAGFLMLGQIFSKVIAYTITQTLINSEAMGEQRMQ